MFLKILIYVSCIRMPCLGKSFADITEWTSTPGSEALSAKEQMLNSIRQHLKEREIFQRNGDVCSYSEDVDDSNETDILWLNIYRTITVISLLAVICRQVSSRLNRYKTLYIIKSRRWLDEDGQMIAIATSIPISQDSTVLQSFGDRRAKNVDCLRDRKRDQIVGGGDLWMLLMSEEDLDLDKKNAGTKSKKRSLIKKLRRNIQLTQAI